jgi:hypothetical protein
MKSAPASLLGASRRPLTERAADWKAELLDNETARHWTLDDDRVVTISGVEASDSRVAFHVAVHDRRGRLVHEENHVVINPPLNVRGGTDEAGNPVYVRDIPAVLREIVGRNLP